METIEILNNIVENHQVLAYLIIFFGLIFEGEVVIITAGVLAYVGALNFWLALVFIIAGGIAKSFGCYYLGVILYNKYQNHRFFCYIEKRVLYFMPRFKEKPFWSIFISKFITGVNYLVCIFSGYHRVNFKTYLKAEILTTVIWLPILYNIGYFFSQTALSWSDDIGKFSLVILGFVVVFILFDKFIATILRIYLYTKQMANGISNGGKK